MFCADSAFVELIVGAELFPNMVVNLFPTICFRVPVGDTVSSRGVAKGERPVLLACGVWRLWLALGACCNALLVLRNCDYKAPFAGA